jgi:hypothetical protein
VRREDRQRVFTTESLKRIFAMVTSMARGAKHPIDRETRWNFGDSRGTSLSLDEFLAQKEADGVEFFAGKEPWLVGLPAGRRIL